jgi:hypothetical protein
MRKGRLLVFVASCALVAGVAATAAAAPTRTACTAGPFSKNGASGVAFCGPAKATAKVGGKTYAFTSGTCASTSKYVSLNLGTEVLTGPKGSYSYFGLLVGAYPGANPGTKAAAKDGSYGGGLATLRWKGKDFILNGAGDKTVKITLKNGRTAGTFSGTTFIPPHVKITGSFTC